MFILNGLNEAGSWYEFHGFHKELTEDALVQPDTTHVLLPDFSTPFYVEWNTETELYQLTSPPFQKCDSSSATLEWDFSAP